MMKVSIELAEQPLKLRRNKKRLAFNKETRIIKKALKQFLTKLDQIYKKHEELGDSAVRDRMFVAILGAFIKPEKRYVLPKRFGMFSDEADIPVHEAIRRFLEHPEVVAAGKSLKTPEERLNAFQDSHVKTSEGTNYIEYFGVRGGVAP